MVLSSVEIKSENIFQVIEYDDYDHTYQLLDLLSQENFNKLGVLPKETDLAGNKDEQNGIKGLFRVVGNFFSMNAVFAKCPQELKIGNTYRGYFDFEPTEAIQHKKFPTFYPINKA